MPKTCLSLLLTFGLLLSGPLFAQANYPFDDAAELNDFTLHNVSAGDLQNGRLILQDNQAGDGQINAEDDSGILGTNSYNGGLEVILQYTDHAVPDTGYSSRIGLLLANHTYAWETPGTYPHIAGKMFSSIDATWFDFSNHTGLGGQASVSPRATSAYLRLLRQQDEVTAWYWHNAAWRQVGTEAIPYAGGVRVGVRMFANYQDLYSVKLEQLTVNIDQDGDGLIDGIETLLGTDPQVADTDNDGSPDGADLWPADHTHTEKTRIKNRGVVNTQLFRVGDTWSMLVTNLSPDNVTPNVVLYGLAADAAVTVAESGHGFYTQKDGFTDTQALPAFAARLYQFPAAAYTAPDPTQPIYPSTLTSWVLPGAQQLPTDPDTLAVLPSVDAVKDWEVGHADVSFGGGFGEQNAEMKAAVGYMYNQILRFNPEQYEMSLRDRAEQNGLDYEDFMLHFSEDTVLEVRNADHGLNTPFYGVPTILGYTRNAVDPGVVVSGNSGLDTGVWDGADNGGALYVYLFEPFDRLNIDLSTTASDGELLVEYPAAVDGSGMVSQWQAISITDGTNNLSQSGAVSWAPPVDWKRAATYDPASKTGSYFGNDRLVNGGAYYVVRLTWQNGAATTPRLAGVELKRWLQPVNDGSGHYTIPGWDAANDSNGDGYVDDAEFANRSNTAASARFRYEARAVPLGSMWSRYSSWCRPNLGNATLRQYIADYMVQTWAANGEAGAYNDDFFRQLGEDSFQIISGGQLAEYAGRVQDAAVQSAYVDDFKATLGAIKSTTGSDWLSANISAENLFSHAERLPFVESLDAALREDYLLPSLGLSGYFGVNKTWDNFALAAADIKSVVMMHYRYGRAAQQSNTQANWAKDAESGLALYYLMNVPDMTYFQAWNSTFQYGSDNTFTAPTSFWKAGVPKNYAYQPVELLQVDIGQPSNQIPAGKEAMKYMVKTQTPLSDYTLIGDTTDTVLRHAEIGEAGEVTVVPSYIYYLQRSATNTVPDGPAEMVLARNYTNGLVLYRTNFHGRNADFMASTSDPIELPGTYRRVNTDGTLGEPITQITLQGYEGAILVWQPDGDGDGVPDDVDTDDDNDGMPDAWETANGLNPNDPADAAADLDQDGVDNLGEYLAGTDPADDGDYPGLNQAETLLGIYYGSEGWRMDRVNNLQDWHGRKNAALTLYTNWDPAMRANLFTHQLPYIWNNGHVPLITWMPSSDTHDDYATRHIGVQVAAGDHDAYIIAWANDLKAFLAGADGVYGNADDRRAYIALGHEMNGNWYHWSGAPTDYVAMWQHVRELFATVDIDANHLQWMWVANNADFGGFTAEQYYPGDAYVDWVGINGYNWGNTASSDRYRTPEAVFSDMLGRLRTLTDKPVSINEVGTWTDNSAEAITTKDRWIRQLFAYARQQGIQLMSWFNKDKSGYDWQIFDGLNGAATLPDGATKVYPGYKAAVQYPGLIYGDSANPRIITDAAFRGLNPSDTDNDGITDESGVPDLSGAGTGDANGDGVADANQSYVTSLKAYDGANWLTYRNIADGAQSNFVTSPATTDTPADRQLLYDTAQFDLVTGTGAAVSIEVYVDKNTAIADYMLLDNGQNWVAQNASVTHTGNKTKLVFSVTEGGPFDRDGTANGVLQLAEGGVMLKSGLDVTPYAYLFGNVAIGASTPAKTFTLSNPGSRTLGIGAVGLTDDATGQFVIESDLCANQSLAPDASCRIAISFRPTSTGSKSALLRINTDDPDNAVLGVFLRNHESNPEESARRLPPVLNSLEIRDNSGQVVTSMRSNTQYTIIWSILGYHTGYISSVAMFNCSAVTNNSCGANYGDSTRFLSSGAVNPSSTTDGAWSHAGETSKVQTFEYTFTTPNYSTSTPIVIRFYRINLRDQAAGNGGLSLIIPGNHAAQYYDTTGRRVVNEIVP